MLLKGFVHWPRFFLPLAIIFVLFFNFNLRKVVSFSFLCSLTYNEALGSFSFSLLILECLCSSNLKHFGRSVFFHHILESFLLSFGSSRLWLLWLLMVYFKILPFPALEITQLKGKLFWKSLLGIFGNILFLSFSIFFSFLFLSSYKRFTSFVSSH